MTEITVSGLSKTFKKGRHTCQALKDINLQFDHGEMVALIGASGSGKSTLMRHLAGLTIGDRGNIRVLGEVIQADGRLSRKVRRTRTRIGVVFQQFNLVGRLTVMTNVLTGLLGRIPGYRGLFGLFTAAEKQRALAALERVDLHALPHQRASTLSGGQQQRVAIARTLVQDAEVIIADEPIASLDPEAARRVMDTLSKINQEDGRTVLVSLHQVDYAIRYCPRTIALRDGEVVFDGASSELTPEFLRELYGSASEELILPNVTGAMSNDEPVKRDHRPISDVCGPMAVATG